MVKDEQTLLLKSLAKHMRDLHLWTVDQARIEEQRLHEIRAAAEREKRLLKRLDRLKFWLIVIAVTPLVSFVLSLIAGALALSASLLPIEL